MRLSDLQRKDIIDINTGKRIGKIIDVEIDEINGTMVNLIIEKTRYLKSVFSNETDTKILYNQIKKMGEDVILVDIS